MCAQLSQTITIMAYGVPVFDFSSNKDKGSRFIQMEASLIVHSQDHN